ncbi:ParB/RepB/Spo0J family partition protein [Vibrio rotiferianus]|uniref:ParB/RepB/Spo0J family partition protein n=1 Tax=Vibrio rotiferianus TaxID=190895 RepID=UPI0005F07C0B|nr:ParB/RepB/Spo0J family partition protein [Vibrio rotiferianus]
MFSEGLSKLLSSGDFDYEEQLSIDEIYPDLEQPRQNLCEEDVQDIVESLQDPKSEIWQPILVHEADEKGHKIIFGGRRYLGSKLAGRETIKALIWKKPDDVPIEYTKVIQLLENITRKDLTIFEEGAGFVGLKTINKMTGQAIASAVGRPASYVSEAIKMYEMKNDPSLKFLYTLYSNGICRDVTMLTKMIRLARKNVTVFENLVAEAIKNDCLTRKWVNELTNADLEADQDEILKNMEERFGSATSTKADSESDSTSDNDSTDADSESDSTSDSDSTDADSESDSTSDNDSTDADSETDINSTCSLRSVNSVTVIYGGREASLMLDRVDSEEGFAWILSDGEPQRAQLDELTLLNVG